MASNVRFLDQVSVGTFQGTNGGDTGSFLVNAISDPSGSGIVFTRGDGNQFTVEVTAEIFPYTGSAGISGSIDLVGPLNITASINQTALSIHIEDANGPDDKFQVNGQGIPVLAPLTFPPTPVSGGMYYSINNEFFLGFA